MLNTLSIRNLKSIQDETYAGFKRCNIVVGKNDSGKTTFLQVVLGAYFGEDVPGFIRALYPTSEDLIYSIKRLLCHSTLPYIFTISGDDKTYRHEITEDGDHLRWTCNDQVFIIGSTLNAEQLFGSKPAPFTPAQTFNEVQSVQVVTALQAIGRLEFLLEVVRMLDENITGIVLKEGVVYLENLGQHLIPLSYSGSGIWRIFAITAGFVYNQGGIYVIESLEQSFHALVVRQLPQWLYTLSGIFKVQLFASVLQIEFCDNVAGKYEIEDEYTFINRETRKLIPGALAGKRHKYGIRMDT
jgi:hypothetical protein